MKVCQTCLGSGYLAHKGHACRGCYGRGMVRSTPTKNPKVRASAPSLTVACPRGHKYTVFRGQRAACPHC